jgi:hypothetical protein
MAKGNQWAGLGFESQWSEGKFSRNNENVLSSDVVVVM